MLRKTLDSATGDAAPTRCNKPAAAAPHCHTPRIMSPVEPDRSWRKEGPRTSAKSVVPIVVRLRKELACFILFGASRPD